MGMTWCKQRSSWSCFTRWRWGSACCEIWKTWTQKSEMTRRETTLSWAHLIFPCYCHPVTETFWPVTFQGSRVVWDVPRSQRIQNAKRGNFTQLSKKWDRLNCSTVVDSIRCTKKQRKTWPVQPKKFALAPVTQNRAVPWVIWVKNGEAPKTPRIIIFPYWQWSFMIRYWGIDHR